MALPKSDIHLSSSRTAPSSFTTFSSTISTFLVIWLTMSRWIKSRAVSCGRACCWSWMEVHCASLSWVRWVKVSKRVNEGKLNEIWLELSADLGIVWLRRLFSKARCRATVIDSKWLHDFLVLPSITRGKSYICEMFWKFASNVYQVPLISSKWESGCNLNLNVP